MDDLLKQLEQKTIVDARNKTATIPYELFFQFAAHVQQLESQLKILRMQVSSGIRRDRQHAGPADR